MSDTVYKKIVQKLKKFNPIVLELEDQSSMHGDGLGSGTHFKLLLVSNYFLGKTKVQRQREVTNELREEFANGLHALSQRILDEDEYKNSNSIYRTTPCINKVK